MALPLLEQMGWAEDPKKAARAPVRMAFIHFGMGVIDDHWKFSQAKGAPLPGCFEPVKKHMGDLLVLNGLAQAAAMGGADGAGDHAREAGCFLTGTRLRKTSGKDIYNGISVDQLAAQKVGGYTTLPSIELSMEGGSGSGDCDSGYSCAYSSNISWRSPTTPMAKETNPKSAFNRLFADRGQSNSAQAQAALAAENKSLLDLVNEDASRLKKSLGGNDGRKLDEYLDSVRALESRIQKISGHEDEDPAAAGAKSEFKVPNGAPKDFAEHARLMFDIMALGFQSDTTRIATFMLTNGGSGRSYPEIGVTGGHHELSHHGRDESKISGIRKINVYHMTQFAYFLDKLKAVKEGKGTLLDNCMIMYGSCIGDGDRHNHNDLPIVLAGSGGGTIRTGRVVPSCRGNLCDLYLGMLARMGVEVPTFGDSSGKMLPDLVS
jgi:hypothetical protein